ncbi:hypothetical protein B0T09DRAFT_359404 [Sordaria sp. MPI-SDFR-AT-0083]|nr:hypothetical protein B0T09DRAFT_359404 [Sordaria sp. MPI-SDFR-AT-0083]
MDAGANSKDTLNDTSNNTPHGSSNTSYNIPSNFSSNDTSNNTSGGSSNTNSNDSAYDSSNGSGDLAPNAPGLAQSYARLLSKSARRQRFMAEIQVSTHPQATRRPGSNRHQRLRSAFRALIEPRDPPSYPSYGGPDADCTEALRVLPCCGACFVDMDKPESGGDQPESLITVLYGLKGQLSYVGHIDPFPSFFRSASSHFGYTVESAYTIVDDKWCLYHTHPPWRPLPSVKHESWPFDIVPRYTVIAYHHDCYVTFPHACPLSPELARERLWLASVARYPGPRPYYYKVTSPTVYDMSEVAIREVARAYGLPELATCPTELVPLIHEYSSPGVFLWRAILTYTLALQLASLPDQPFTEIPLVDIRTWERGDLLLPSDWKHVYPTNNVESVMRIKLDNRGIKEIQGLPRHPSFTGGWSNNVGFIVENVSTLRECTACVKNGFLCLRFPKFYKFELPMWDTPAPPSPAHTTRLITERFGPPLSRYFPVHKGISTSHILNFKSVTGLTFMFSHKTDLRSIFAHYNNETGHYDSDVVQKLKTRHLCYLPIAPEDEILNIGIIEHENSRIFVRMRLTGDIIINLSTHDSIGRPQYGRDPDSRPPVIWSKTKPRALVYGQGCGLHEDNIIFATKHDLDNSEGIGTPPDDVRSLTESNIRTCQCSRLPGIHNVPFNGLVTYAPLSEVLEARVYYLDEGIISEGACLGIVFRDHTHFLVGSKYDLTTVDFLPASGADKPQSHRLTEKDATIRSKYRPMRGTIFAYTRYNERKMYMRLHLEIIDEDMYPGTASAEKNEV